VREAVKLGLAAAVVHAAADVHHVASRDGRLRAQPLPRQPRVRRELPLTSQLNVAGERDARQARQDGTVVAAEAAEAAVRLRLDRFAIGQPDAALQPDEHRDRVHPTHAVHDGREAEDRHRPRVGKHVELRVARNVRDLSDPHDEHPARRPEMVVQLDRIETPDGREPARTFDCQCR
jgi:hypothetical protein